MFSSFKQRKPWASAFITFFLGPMLGMFYLGKATIGLLYIPLFIVVGLAPFILMHFGIIDVDPDNALTIVYYGFVSVGAIHAYIIAKRNASNVPDKWYARWYSLILVLYILPIVAALLFRAFLFEPFHIPSISMSPTVQLGDYLFAKKYAYFSHVPERGDVIVFKSPQNLSLTYIKRIVGMPGDAIQIKNGRLFINNAEITQQSTNSFRYIDDGNIILVPKYKESLPENLSYEIIRFGGNPECDDTEVIQVSTGNYFVLSDNRDRGMDSRFTEFGLIPEKNITGKAAMVMWNNQVKKFMFRKIQ